MRLREERSTFNFYESFSDLIFCTLVLFVVLVSVLAVNVHRRATVLTERQANLLKQADELEAQREQTATRAQELEEKYEQWKQALINAERTERAAEHNRHMAEEAEARVAELESKLTAAEAAASADRSRLGRRVASAAGINRFVGRIGGTSLALAVDLSGSQPRYVPIDAATFADAHAAHPGESADETIRRRWRLITDNARGRHRFDEDELLDLFKALEWRASGGRREEGQLSIRYSLAASAIVSGWFNAGGEFDISHVPESILRLADSVGLEAYHEHLVNRVIELRDQTKAGDPPTVPVLRFGVTPDREAIRLGGSEWVPENFVELLRAIGDGGIILEYVPAPQSPDVCPAWVHRKVLVPAGYTSNAPDPAALRELERELIP